MEFVPDEILFKNNSNNRIKFDLKKNLFCLFFIDNAKSIDISSTCRFLINLCLLLTYDRIRTTVTVRFYIYSNQELFRQQEMHTHEYRRRRRREIYIDDDDWKHMFELITGERKWSNVSSNICLIESVLHLLLILYLPEEAVAFWLNFVLVDWHSNFLFDLIHNELMTWYSSMIDEEIQLMLSSHLFDIVEVFYHVVLWHNNTMYLSKRTNNVCRNDGMLKKENTMQMD